MRRKIIFRCAVMLLLFCAVQNFFFAAAQEGRRLTILIDSEELVYDESVFGAAYIDASSGRTLVPLRILFETFGAQVTWDADSSTALAVKGETSVQIQIGAAEAFVNDVPITLDQPAVIVDDRTMVPLRFVAQSLGYNVRFDEINTIVFIQTTNETSTEQTDYEAHPRIIDAGKFFGIALQDVYHFGDITTYCYNRSDVTVSMVETYVQAMEANGFYERERLEGQMDLVWYLTDEQNEYHEIKLIFTAATFNIQIT